MKQLLICLLLIGIAGCGSNAEIKNTPAGLLKKIYSLAQKEDYERLQECIFPFVDKGLPDGLLQGIRETGGFATAVDDGAIDEARRKAAELEGILLCPEGAATYAAYLKELKSGRVTTQESAILFNCATGLKYPMPAVNDTLDHHKPVDYSLLV